jgi:anti-anti-sigma regulatory factor
VVELRTFRLGNGSWVIALRGAIDAHLVDETLKELAERDGDAVIFDLLRAQVVDLDALDALVEASGSSATFVAERPLLDALHLIGLRRYVHVEPTIAAALA